MFRDREQARNSLVADMRWLASHLAGVGHILAVPSLDDNKRQAILTRYRLRDPRKAELGELLRQPLSSSSARLLVLVSEALQPGELEDDYHAALARALTSVVRSGTDQPETALMLALPTTELWRKLARDHPDDFVPNLSEGLGLIVGLLSALGRHQEALPPAQEAVGMYRRLSTANPDTFRPNLAASLGNQANILSAVERPDEALLAAEEAVEIYRALAAANPSAWAPNLAAMLGNQANYQSALRRHQDALSAGQEAANIYQTLVAAGPELRPHLAAALVSLSGRLSALGRSDDTSKAMEDAVAVYRELARERPEAFTPDLAKSLNTLGKSLIDSGRRTEAEPFAQEAADLYGPLAQSRPDRFKPGLTEALNNLTAALSTPERRTEALAVAQKAADLLNSDRSRNDDAEAVPSAKRIYLSYSSLDVVFITQFKMFLEECLGDSIAIFDYRDESHFGNIVSWLDHDPARSAAVILFISEDYMRSEFLPFELPREPAGGRSICVPVMIDVAAEEWWRTQRRENALRDLIPAGGSYSYVKFTASSGGAVPLVTPQGVPTPYAQRVIELAILIRKALESATAPAPVPVLAPVSPNSQIVVLGHPDGALAPEVQELATALARALQAQGKSPAVWGDGWARDGNDAARPDAERLLAADTIFVQPLGVWDAQWVAKEPESPRESLAAIAGKPDNGSGGVPSEIVLWLPSGLSSPAFDTAQTAPPTRCSRKAPSDLALELAALAGTQQTMLPIIMLQEEFANDPELRDALHKGFQNVVSDVINSTVSQAPIEVPAS